MLKGKKRLKFCGRIIVIVILLSFLTIFPVFAEPQTEQLPNSTNELTRFYSDLEINLLIDEIREAAHEAIEHAAGEAARAAFLESLEREGAALQEAAHQRADATRWRIEAQRNLQAAHEARRARVKNVLLAGVICFLGGFAFGVTGSFVFGGR